MRQQAISARQGRPWGTVRFANGEPVTVSFSRFSGMRVRKSRFGFFGPTLYEQRDTYIAARTGIVLSHLYPDRKFPAEVSDLNLRSYLNAILHCESAAEVSRVLHQAEEVRPTDDLAEGLPDWARPPEGLAR